MVSVVVPTFNRLPLLKHALSSVLLNWKDFESLLLTTAPGMGLRTTCVEYRIDEFVISGERIREHRASAKCRRAGSTWPLARLS